MAQGLGFVFFFFIWGGDTGCWVCVFEGGEAWLWVLFCLRKGCGGSFEFCLRKNIRNLQLASLQMQTERGMVLFYYP